MDLNRVSAFVRVVADGSFTGAARALGLPKSSVSRSVAQLEQDLGIRLLHRTTRKLHLTDAGAAFYDRVSRALTDIDEATVAAADMQAELRGTVRVTAPVDLGAAVLAPVVARFVRKHPAIHIDLVLTGRVVDMVAEGFDLAVRVGPLRDSSLIARRVGQLDSALYASRKYVARRGKPKDVDDLANHDCVLFRPTQGKELWRIVNPAGEKREVSVVGAISADDLSFVRKAVLSGAGIARLPQFLCGREEASGVMVRVLPEWASEGGILHMAYPSARYVPQRVSVFREFAAGELAKVSKQCEAAELARRNG